MFEILLCPASEDMVGMGENFVSPTDGNEYMFKLKYNSDIPQIELHDTCNRMVPINPDNLEDIAEAFARMTRYFVRKDIAEELAMQEMSLDKRPLLQGVLDEVAAKTIKSFT